MLSLYMLICYCRCVHFAFCSFNLLSCRLHDFIDIDWRHCASELKKIWNRKCFEYGYLMFVLASMYTYFSYVCSLALVFTVLTVFRTEHGLGSRWMPTDTHLWMLAIKSHEPTVFGSFVYKRVSLTSVWCRANETVKETEHIEWWCIVNYFDSLLSIASEWMIIHSKNMLIR